jgi:hypothetical protein
MPKQQLTGTLEEQCEFLYKLAQQKMAEGNFTGAVHALQEVAKYKPNDQQVQALLAEARQRKASQRLLLLCALGGAALFIAIGTIYQVGNDLLFIGLAIIGSIVGYGVGNVIQSLRRTRGH